jgi:hypothetical protein
MDSIVLIMSGIFIKKFDHFVLRYSAIAPFNGIIKIKYIYNLAFDLVYWLASIGIISA